MEQSVMHNSAQLRPVATWARHGRGRLGVHVQRPLGEFGAHPHVVHQAGAQCICAHIQCFPMGIFQPRLIGGLLPRCETCTTWLGVALPHCMVHSVGNRAGSARTGLLFARLSVGWSVRRLIRYEVSFAVLLLSPVFMSGLEPIVGGQCRAALLEIVIVAFFP